MKKIFSALFVALLLTATAFAGGGTTPPPGGGSGGSSSPIVKYVSQLGCAQNTDLNAGGGTDDTACINSFLATATPTHPIKLIQDGDSLISGRGLILTSNTTLEGTGAGVAKVNVTNCAISGGTATLTAQNSFSPGQVITLTGFSTCTTLNNSQVAVVTASSTQFTVAYTGTVASSAENAVAARLYGTGFFLAASSQDAISNGPWGTTSNCDLGAGTPLQMQANINLQGFAINGNETNQSAYCFGADFNNVSNLNIKNVVFYNAARYSVKTSNVNGLNIDGVTVYTSSSAIGNNTDGFHIEGPSANITIANSTLRTGDDAIALNAVEGYCGPISKVEINNVVSDNTAEMLRIYNRNLAACGNGLAPVVSTVDINNYSGTTSLMATLGLGDGTLTLGSTFPALSNIHWSNSTVTQTGAYDAAILDYDNIGSISFSNFDFVSKNSAIASFIALNPDTSYTPKHGVFEFSNFTWHATASGNSFSSPIQAGAFPIQNLTFQGFALVGDNGTSPPAAYIAGNLYGTTVSTFNVSGVDSSTINIGGSGSNVHVLDNSTTFDGTNYTINGNLSLGTHTVTAQGATINGVASATILNNSGSNFQIQGTNALFFDGPYTVHPYSGTNFNFGESGNVFNSMWATTGHFNNMDSFVINPPGSSNGSISFGAYYGAPALKLYDSGTGNVFGWGLNAGEQQFFGGSLDHISYNTAGGSTGMQPTGTWEQFRISLANQRTQLGSGGCYSFTSSAPSGTAGTGAGGTVDTQLCRSAAGILTSDTTTQGNGLGSYRGSSLILNGSTSGTYTLTAPAVAGSLGLQFPSSAGTSGYFLQTNGAGVTSWASAGIPYNPANVAITGGTISGATVAATTLSATSVAATGAFGAWTNTSPSISCGTGVFVTSLDTQITGKTAKVNLVINVTSAGTCTGTFATTFPFTLVHDSIVPCLVENGAGVNNAAFYVLNGGGTVGYFQGNGGANLMITGAEAVCTGQVQTQ